LVYLLEKLRQNMRVIFNTNEREWRRWGGYLAGMRER
jgi:hypothetical protein